MAYNNITIGLIKEPLLPPATKLGQDYVFTRVCDSVHGGISLSVLGGGVCPGWGALCPMDGLCSGGSLSGGSLLEDLCPGGLCPGGLCPGGSLSRGVSVLGVSVLGGLCHGDPRMVTSGWYASYWNAFVLIIMILFYNEYY